MKYNDNETVNIKDMIINIILKWRYILTFAIIFAAIFGLKQVMVNIVSDENEVVQQYQIEYNDYINNLDIKNRRIEKKGAALGNQIEYNKTSIKMKINPFDFIQGTLSIYIRTNEINPTEQLYQSIQVKNQILDAYSEYVINGTFYSELVDKLSYETETSYIKEIVKITFDPNNQMINFSVMQENRALCKELLEQIYELITEKRLEIVSEIGEHEVIKYGESVYSAVDLDLDEFQQSKIELVDTMKMELDVLNSEMGQYKDSAPMNAYNINSLVKQGIKNAVIAFVIVAMLMVIYFFVIELISKKLNSIRNFKEVFEIPVIGEFNKRRNSRVDSWIKKTFNRIHTPLIEDDDKIQVLSEIVKNIVSENDEGESDSKQSVYIIGSSSSDVYDYYSKKIEQATTDSAIKFIAGKDIMSDISTAKNINQYQHIIILEQFGVSKYVNIEKELELLKQFNKKVIGCIVVDI